MDPLSEVFLGRSHGGRGLGSNVGGDDEMRRRNGNHPGLKGDEDLEGRTAMLEEVKKYRARVTEPHLEQLR